MSGFSLPALAPVPAPPISDQRSLPSDPAKLRKAAQDFEAMAIGQLLQPMFDTLDTGGGLFGGGAGERTWRPVLVQEMAKKIAAGGGFGLAEPIYRSMLQVQEARSR
jgi:Rod binding domain-containing protein